MNTELLNLFYVFDLDGTLIDSDKIHYNALIKSGWTISYEEYENLLNTTGITLDPDMQKIKDANMNYDDVHFIKGADALIDYIHQNDINHVVVTNSRRGTVEKFKERLPHLAKLKNWVTREDYKNPKPSPDGYQLGIKKYHKGEKNILGFENTVNGYKSLKHVTDTIFMVNMKIDGTHFISDYNLVAKPISPHNKVNVP
jgi:beta-phosphoglucomutase-like phosphatase (HAD superfamily)